MTAGPRRSTGLGTAAAAALLLLAAPSPSAAVRQLAAAGDAADPTEPVVALASLLAWGLAGWLVIVVATTAAGHLPGLAGRAGAAVARRVAPVAMRRAVEVTLGLTVAVGTIGASPALAATGGLAGGPGAMTYASAAAPTVDRQAVGREGAAPASVDDPAVQADPPGLDWPVAAAPPAPPPQLDWPATGAHPAEPEPPRPAAAASPAEAPPEETQRDSAPADRAQPAPTIAAAGDVVVQPGDTLWDLTKDDLVRRGAAAPTAAEVAQAWPSWWAANREVVGDDPDLLHPGTPLTPPADNAGPPGPS